MLGRRAFDESVSETASAIEHELLEGDEASSSERLLFTDADQGRPLFAHDQWHLVPALVRLQFRSRYKQSGLHVAWNVVQPAVMFGVYALFFHGVLKIGSDDLPYLSFVIVGLVPWRFFANGMGSASALIDNIQLISKVYFPREIIPIVNVLGGSIDLLVGTVLMVLVAVVQGVSPSYQIVALPFVYLLLLFVTLSLTIVLTTVSVFIRDVSYGMQLVLLGLFFATPIMYPVSQLPSWLQWFPQVNPLAVVVTQVRRITLMGQWPEWGLLTVHLLVGACMVVASVAYVRSVEHRLVDLA